MQGEGGDICILMHRKRVRSVTDDTVRDRKIAAEKLLRVLLTVLHGVVSHNKSMKVKFFLMNLELLIPKNCFKVFPPATSPKLQSSS